MGGTNALIISFLRLSRRVVSFEFLQKNCYKVPHDEQTDRHEGWTNSTRKNKWEGQMIMQCIRTRL